jgi:hypothetical protein
VQKEGLGCLFESTVGMLYFSNMALVAARGHKDGANPSLLGFYLVLTITILD